MVNLKHVIEVLELPLSVPLQSYLSAAVFLVLVLVLVVVVVVVVVVLVLVRALFLFWVSAIGTRTLTGTSTHCLYTISQHRREMCPSVSLVGAEEETRNDSSERECFDSRLPTGPLFVSSTASQRTPAPAPAPRAAAVAVAYWSTSSFLPSACAIWSSCIGSTSSMRSM